MPDVGKLVLLMGPSGVGKSVILKELRNIHAEWHFPRSATTRPMRNGEGDDLYRFLSNTEFDQLISDGKILEWAQVHEGARYGTLVDEIIPAIDDGKIVIREVDVQGFDSIRRHELFSGQYALQSIFIIPENKGQLIAHITKRAPMEQEELIRRLESMEKEMAYAKLCDHTVVNAEGEMEKTVKSMERIITRRS